MTDTDQPGKLYETISNIYALWSAKYVLVYTGMWLLLRDFYAACDHYCYFCLIYWQLYDIFCSVKLWSV
jgi:hypothetical protein